MPERFMQDGGGPGPIDVHFDLGGLADAIWHSFLGQLPQIGQGIWTPLSEWAQSGVHASADAFWSNASVAVAELMFQLPPALTYNLPAYRAIQTNPLEVALGGITLAVVLLGLRTLFGALAGADHVGTHITGRLIPAAAACVSYAFLVTWFVDHINVIGAAIGPQAWGGFLRFPTAPNAALVLPMFVLWVVILYYSIKLLIRLAYSLFRFLVALVFGPVAIILWAIPQTEWITSFWIREMVGWGTTPLLVAVALALALPMAAGSTGFLGAALFGIGGLQAAYDLAGLFASSKGGGGGPLGAIAGLGMRMAAGAATGGAAAAAIPPNQVSTIADQYGYN